MNYFAYGSNMDEQQMAAKQVSFTKKEKAVLQGYRLTFNKKTANGSGRATIIKSADADLVEGILYEILEEDLVKLDKPERYPEHYSRIEVPVILDSGTRILATTYIANSDWISEGLMPMESYLQTILNAREMVSDDYYKKLKDTPFIPQEKRREISEEEIYSEKFLAGGRTYFFDIKANSKGDYYIAISESKKTATGFERHRVIVFEDHADNFLNCVISLTSKLRELRSENIVNGNDQ